MKVANTVHIESSHPKKKIFVGKVTDDNYTYCGGLFTAYTNIWSLCCTAEINIMLQVGYTSIKRKNSKNLSLKKWDYINVQTMKWAKI